MCSRYLKSWRHDFYTRRLEVPNGLKVTKGQSVTQAPTRKYNSSCHESYSPNAIEPFKLASCCTNVMYHVTLLTKADINTSHYP